MTDLEYQLNELYKEITGKICTTMNSDAVESMREAYQETLEEIQEDIIHYVYDTLLSDDAEAMEQPIIDIIDKLRG